MKVMLKRREKNKKPSITALTDRMTMAFLTMREFLPARSIIFAVARLNGAENLWVARNVC